MSQVAATNVRSELYIDNGLLVHEALLRAEIAKNVSIQCFYLPKQFVDCWKHVTNLSPGHEFRRNFYREVVHSRYEDVICANFANEAMEGLEPILLLREGVSDKKLTIIFADFIRFFEQKMKYHLSWLEKEKQVSLDGYTLPRFEIKAGRDIQLQAISLWELSQMKAKKNFFTSWFSYEYARQVGRVVMEKGLDARTYWSMRPKGNSSTFTFPKRWYLTTYEAYAQVASEIQSIHDPNPRADNKDLVFSYFHNLHFDFPQDGEKDACITIRFFVTVKRWLSHMQKNDRLFFSSKGRKTINRSFYVRKDDINRMVRLTIGKNNVSQKVDFINKYDVQQFLNDENMPDLENLLRNLPNYRDQFLVPYQVADVGLERRNEVNSGAHPNEQLIMFQSFMEVFQFLELNRTNFSPIEHENLEDKLIGGTIFLDDTYQSRDNQSLVIEVVSKETHVLEQVKMAIKQTTYGPLLKFTEDSKRKVKSGNNSKTGVTKEPINESDLTFILEEFRPDTDVYSESSSASYRLISRQTGELWATIYIVHRPEWCKFGERLAEGTDIDTAVHRRVQEIINGVPTANSHNPNLTLFEIPEFAYGGKIDSYKAVKFGMLETNRITQMFHPFSENEKLKSKIISSIRDLLIRKGFHNQLGKYLHAATKDLTFYFPLEAKVKLNSGEIGSIPILFRLHKGITEARYLKSEWMPIDEAIVYLKQRNKPTLLEKQPGSFMEMVSGYCQCKQDVLVFRREDVPESLQKVISNRGKLPFILTVFSNAFDVPYISKISKGSLSTGKYYMESNGDYFCVPPRHSQMSFGMWYTKQYINKPMGRVVPMKVKVHGAETQEEEIDIVVAMQLMRSTALTWNGFLSMPLPNHLFAKHFESFCTDKWENYSPVRTNEDDETDDVEQEIDLEFILLTEDYEQLTFF